MDGAMERREGGSELRREEATERGRGAREERGRKGDREGAREEQGRSEGDREGGKLQGRYPEEDTGQYTAHKTTHNVALAIAILVNCKRVYQLCIVMRHNVLFDRWMTGFYVNAIMDWVHNGVDLVHNWETERSRVTI